MYIFSKTKDQCNQPHASLIDFWLWEIYLSFISYHDQHCQPTSLLWCFVGWKCLGHVPNMVRLWQNILKSSEQNEVSRSFVFLWFSPVPLRYPRLSHAFLANIWHIYVTQIPEESSQGIFINSISLCKFEWSICKSHY